MLTGAGEWRLLRGDLNGDCVIFCGDGSAFPGDDADLRGDLRSDFAGLAEFCQTNNKNDNYQYHFRAWNCTIMSHAFPAFPCIGTAQPSYKCSTDSNF